MTFAELAEGEKLPLTLTVEEAGELLGLSRSSAYRAVARGEIPAIRLGRRLVVPSAKLLALVGIEPDRHRDRRRETAVTAAVTGRGHHDPVEAASA